jgi:uncharacterized membrane protein
LPGSALPEETAGAVITRYPLWTPGDEICAACLARSLDSAPGDDPPADPPEPAVFAHEEMWRPKVLGEKISDGVASFVGSWTFLNSQVVLLIIWIIYNSIAIFHFRFDPYPYILLNLLLSWIGALETPLILMSQNRQDTRDRQRDDHDYHTNLQAEQEVRHLHRKMDKLIEQFWPEILALHQQQLALIDLLPKREEEEE